MKKTLFYLLFLISTGVVIFFSCQREPKWNINKPPIAVAGPDQVITLPTDSLLLDGSNSSDPDGKISEWLWTKISGPASFNIIRPSDSIAKVKSLVMGTYQFELKITDNGGLSAKDTLMVIVNDPSIPNRPPVANAGSDQTITLPTNTIPLNGNGSTDPDNNITNYTWTKISGPSSYNIANASSVQTQVINLVEGIYQLELKVTDARGLFSRDTMQVTVSATSVAVACDGSIRPQVNVQLIPIGTLSQARDIMAVASAGNKIVFAGGRLSQYEFSSAVDIYDMVTQTWSKATLSKARANISTVSAGDKIFFAGGGIKEDDDYYNPYSVVDIYNISTNTWSIDSLSGRYSGPAAAMVGNKVFFAGGFDYDSVRLSGNVDIYDMVTQTWSTATLSEARTSISAVTVSNKIYFAGGRDLYSTHFSSRVDIYDNITNTWSTAELSEPNCFWAGIAAADKIYWPGGQLNLCLVEIREVNTWNSSFANLYKPQGTGSVVKKGNELLFFGGGNKFDIYDITTNTWSIGVLPVNTNIGGTSIISINNTIYVAGGYVNGVLSNQVWKLEF